MLHSTKPLSSVVSETTALHSHRMHLPNSPPAISLQDNAPWHTCDDSMSELQELVDDCIIGHPAQSPDLNIMEDLWSYLDRKAKAAKIKTLQGLKRKLMAEAAVELHSNVCTVNANPAGRV